VRAFGYVDGGVSNDRTAGSLRRLRDGPARLSCDVRRADSEDQHRAAGPTRTNRGQILSSVEESALGRRMITENSQQPSAVEQISNCRAGRSLYTFPSEHAPLGRRELPAFILPFPSCTSPPDTLHFPS
jgi:hypothetical protein